LTTVAVVGGRHEGEHEKLTQTTMQLRGDMMTDDECAITDMVRNHKMYPHGCAMVEDEVMVALQNWCEERIKTMVKVERDHHVRRTKTMKGEAYDEQERGCAESQQKPNDQPSDLGKTKTNPCQVIVQENVFGIQRRL